MQFGSALLLELYPQGPTPVYCDNTCAVGLATDTLKAAKTKAIDLRFHCLRDRVRQGQFKILWIATDDNIADFFTKALPVHEHRGTCLELYRSVVGHVPGLV